MGIHAILAYPMTSGMKMAAMTIPAIMEESGNDLKAIHPQIMHFLTLKLCYL